MKTRLSDYVGNTPLIPIKIGELTVWGKCEFMNPGGSVKDRMATFILNDAEKRGVLKKGDTICEATSGNSGIAFAMLAAERGYKMEIFMPRNMSEERKQMFQFYGANLREVDEGDFDGAILRRDVLSRTHGWFNCNQFSNPLNIQAHYENTAPEIYEEWSLPKTRGSYRRTDSPAVFIAGTGTGGTLMGCGKKLKEFWNKLKVVAIEPAESAVMSGGDEGLHGIQGIGDGSKFLVDLDFVDEIKTVKTDCAKEMAKHLALRYGLFVGISAGANVKAAFQWLRDNNEKEAITILCDRGERYFSCL
jgi:cysteine synthase A